MEGKKRRVSWNRKKQLTHILSSILQAPTMQLEKMSIDLKFVKLTADVLDFFFFIENRAHGRG